MRSSSGRNLSLLLLLMIVASATAFARNVEAESDANLHIEIISPNDGEIFYASKLGYIVSLPITGFITGVEESPETVQVELTIWTAHGNSDPLKTSPDENGFFAFYLDLNPENEPLPTVGERFFYYNEICADCHFATGNELPLGPIRLEFTATTTDGQSATVEKRMSVDRSQYAVIPVEVVLDNGNETSVEGMPVFAETRIYEWRGRKFMELTDESGLANLRVEALTQRDTRYLLSVPPTLIDNVRYQSTNTLEVLIKPGEERVAPIVLRVTAEDGEITGIIHPSLGFKDVTIDVVAIALPSGLLLRDPVQSDGTFSFTGLPLSEYLMAVDVGKEGTGAFSAEPEIVDLVESPVKEISLAVELGEESAASGRLVNESGDTIPFGWLSIDGAKQGEQVSPLDGRFEIGGVRDPETPITITAPGYWSQSFQLADLSATSDADITLKSRPDQQLLEWGDGQVIIPHESVTRDENGQISLVRGWIWGKNDIPERFAVEMEGALMEVDEANFALEYRPGDVSWLYVTDGMVTFTTREGEPIEIRAGDMIAFGDGVPKPTPVNADKTAVYLLRNGDQPTVALGVHKEPPLSQRIVEALTSVGLNLSQGLVAITYLAMFVMVIGAILYGVRKLTQGLS